MPVARPSRGLFGGVALAAVLSLAVPHLSSAQTSTTDTRLPGARTTASLRLRPGDLVRLRIWRQDDMSGEYPVDETGTVVFPLIGPRHVTDMRPDSLKQELVEAYTKYLRHPSIDVVLLRRINILGAVRQPGLYPVDPTMTITDALALAGGVVPGRAEDKVELIRGGETLEASLDQRTRMGELGVRSGDQLYVHERSWLTRNGRIFAVALGGAISLFLALVR